MDITTLTPEAKKELLNQLAQEEKNARRKKADDRAALKQMIDETVADIAPDCADFGIKQNEMVDSVFEKFAAIIALKKDIYGFDEKQASHTFTSRKGDGSITVGYNEVPGFDSTVDVGLQKIHAFISSLSKDDANRIKLEKLVSTLTKKNKKGELNPTKVIALSELKADMDDELFTEGVDIVVASQFKTRTTMYVRGWHRRQEENGREVTIAFSITAN